MLIDALKGKAISSNGAKENDIEKEKEEVEKKIVWLPKRGNRRCYVGILKQTWIGKYKRFMLKLILISFDITDAQVMREFAFRRMRKGEMEKVRCYYVQEEEQKGCEDPKILWPYGTMHVMERTLSLLEKKKFVVIFESEWVQGSYTARFGRNPLSTALALHESVEDRDDVWNWMKLVKDDMPWATYVEKTLDYESDEYKLCDFENKPDWVGFEDWKNDTEELRKATDPNEASEEDVDENIE